ncbi:hypothetical protein CEXT_375291 [Caerostris extrusa]|uniref:Uncharacterized protein n=1 Tax=Caerostris extrusa TaxID=172846 RepID=A0AAV4XID4_CAEEX|nr:hypothetical protein CEXT_375291 [Caerostris extrusa]
MCLRSLKDKLPSLTLAVSDFDFRSLPPSRTGFNIEALWMVERNLLARTKSSSLCPAATRSIFAHGSDFSVSFYAKISPIDLNPEVKGK